VTDVRLQEGRIIARFVTMSTSRTNGAAISPVTTRKYPKENLVTMAISLGLRADESQGQEVVW
jgi:hypothetical protein